MKSRLKVILYCVLLVYMDVNAAASSSSSSSSSANLASSPTRVSTISGVVSPKVSPDKEDHSPRMKLYEKTKERVNKAMQEGDATEVEKWLKLLESMYEKDQFDPRFNDMGTFIKDKRALLDRYKEAAKPHGEVAAFEDYFRIHLSQLNKSINNFKKIAAPLTSSSYDIIAIAHEAFNVQEQWNSFKDFVDSYELSNFVLHEMGKKEPKKKIVWQTFKGDMDKQVAGVAKDYGQLLQEYKNLCAQFAKAVRANNQEEAESAKKLIDDQFNINHSEIYRVSHVPDIVEILKMNYEMRKYFGLLDKQLDHSEVKGQLEKLKGKADQSKTHQSPKKLSEIDEPVPVFLIEWDKEFNSRVAQCEKDLLAVRDVDSLIKAMKAYMHVMLWYAQVTSFFMKSDKKTEKLEEFKSYINKKTEELKLFERQMKQQVKETTIEDLSILLNRVNRAHDKAKRAIRNINLNNPKYFDGVLEELQEVVPQYLLLFIAERMEAEIAEINHHAASVSVIGEEPAGRGRKSAVSNSKEVALEKHDFEKSRLLSNLYDLKDVVNLLIKTLDSERMKKHFLPEDIKRWRDKAEAFLTWVDNEPAEKMVQDIF